MPPVAVCVVVPSCIVIPATSAVTETWPEPPVVMFAFCATVSAVKVMLPVVDDALAPRVSVPASAFKVIVPAPCAVTTAVIFKAPASTSTSMLPSPASVRRPVPLIVSALVSCRTILPEAVLVACSVLIVVSRSSTPPPPRPVAAVSVVWPVVVRLAVSATVLSVIAPAVAVRVKAPVVAVMTESAIEVAAVKVVAPVVVEVVVPSAIVIPATSAV